MGFQTSIYVFLAFITAVSAHSKDVRIVVDTSTTVFETDANYICATIDWWPQDKCNYNRCPWGSSSLLNLNLSHPYLGNAIQAFGHLRLRLGGSLQDQVLYEVGNLKVPCQKFKKEKGGLFGFSKGCLTMKRWDELNKFFIKTGALVTFGLNALYGRHHIKRGAWGGDWNSSNARDFIHYTISKRYHIDSWEFGNELCGKGIGASVDAEQYGKDTVHLNAMIDGLYANFTTRPLILAPGGFYDKSWFDKLLQVSGPHVVNVMSHHLYKLGPGNDPNLVSKILNPDHLNKASTTFGNLTRTIKDNGNDPNLVSKILNPDHLNKASTTFGNLTRTIKDNGPWASAWVGESGGVYNNGAKDISNTFINSFWYLDQLGLAAKYNTKVYCRQTLIGGFYGLLNKTTFLPNPDYYSALLWHRLMGKDVLAVTSSASPYLRTYAHCSKERAGVTLLLINLSNQTVYNVDIQSNVATKVLEEEKSSIGIKSFARRLKKSVIWIGHKASDEKLKRKEYHLTPENDDLQSKTMLLNGKPLQIPESGVIPSIIPVFLDVNSRLAIDALSMKFVVYPNFDSPGRE